MSAHNTAGLDQRTPGAALGEVAPSLMEDDVTMAPPQRILQGVAAAFGARRRASGTGSAASDSRWFQAAPDTPSAA